VEKGAHRCGRDGFCCWKRHPRAVQGMDGVVLKGEYARKSAVEGGFMVFEMGWSLLLQISMADGFEIGFQDRGHKSA
jgi:hypothetical protein